MPLIKSGSKPAISSNIREMMKAGHPQDQAVAAALSTARKYGKAAGGGIKIGGKKVPYQIGGNSSKRPWKGYKSGGIVRKAEGGETEVDWSKLNHPMGSIKGTAPEDTPVAFKTPYFDIHEGDIDRATNVGMGSGPGIMVGKYGALALRNQAHEAGQAMKPHPVYAAEDVAATKNLRPEMKDAVMNWRQDARDAAGQQALASRSPEVSDRDIWRATGWHRGTEGAAKKEIPDIGVKLEPVPGDKTGNAFLLKHPAGDLHKAYDIPPIQFDPLMKHGTAVFQPETRQITIGGSDVKGATSTALHEFQHAIQNAEGFGSGSSPKAASLIGPIDTELFPGQVPSWWRGKDARGTGKGPDEHYAQQAPHTGASFNTYERASGEVESRNVQGRRLKSFRYQSHPEDTEDVTRGLQWIPDRQRLMDMIKEPTKKAEGGELSQPPWFVRNEARAPSGMLKSSIPGRTDKIPVKVAGGSYVLPADIPSALGQGNTMAGGSILDKMFTRGPYGMNVMKSKAGTSTKMARMSSLTKTRKSGYAEGGETETAPTPIIAAGGEYILSPEQVAQLGGGNIDAGHKILDQFVMSVRKQHINTLKTLKPPKKD